MADRFELAHDIWPILVAAAERGETLTYGEIAEKLGLSVAIVVGVGLHPLYELTVEKGWPLLTGIVVNQETGKPGPGFEAWEDDELEERWAEVFAFDWSQVPHPFGTRSRERLRPRGPAAPSDAKQDYSVPDIEVTVNGRGPFQDALRKDLLNVYGGRCAVCDTRLRPLLVASHIIPWSQDPENRCNPRNAILLCKTHDAMFEAGWLVIQEDLKVRIDLPVDVDPGSDVSAFLEQSTSSSIQIQRDQYQPAPEFLRWRIKHSKVGGS